MNAAEPVYPAAFRQRIIKLVAADRSRAELARECGCTAQTIANWARLLVQSMCRVLDVSASGYFHAASDENYGSPNIPHRSAANSCKEMSSAGGPYLDRGLVQPAPDCAWLAPRKP